MTFLLLSTDVGNNSEPSSSTYGFPLIQNVRDIERRSIGPKSEFKILSRVLIYCTTPNKLCRGKLRQFLF